MDVLVSRSNFKFIVTVLSRLAFDVLDYFFQIKSTPTRLLLLIIDPTTCHQDF